MKKAAIVVSLAVVFSIVTQRSSKWKPIKTLHLTKESFQNKNTSAQSRLGEHGPLSDVWETSQSLQLYTDAAASIGFGVVFDRHWLHGTWPNHWKSYSIALLEIFPIFIAVHIWGHIMTDKRIIFFTDRPTLGP